MRIFQLIAFALNDENVIISFFFFFVRCFILCIYFHINCAVKRIRMEKKVCRIYIKMYSDRKQTSKSNIEWNFCHLAFSILFILTNKSPQCSNTSTENPKSQNMRIMADFDKYKLYATWLKMPKSTSDIRRTAAKTAPTTSRIYIHMYVCVSDFYFTFFLNFVVVVVDRVHLNKWQIFGQHRIFLWFQLCLRQKSLVITFIWRVNYLF